MKTNRVFLLGALLLAVASSRAAVSANYSITPATFNAGGQHAGSASYSVDATVGGIASQSLAISSAYAVREGYAGQLYEVATLTLGAVNSNLNENASVALAATAVLDDGTKLVPAIVRWSCSGAIASVSPAGLVTAASVYDNLPGVVVGALGKKTVSQNFWVLDSNPDDWGIYANDGIPDAWQVQYFGTNNPNGTGPKALFAYVAGLNPTNPASVFSLSVARVSGKPNIVFSPRLTNRTYAVQYRTSLVGGSFLPLNGTTQTDNGNVRTVTDLTATNASRFYRVQISNP